MYEVGRLCVKIAGRDAGLRCVVIDVVDEKTVLIDGQTRRRNCNVKHLEPLKETIKLKKGASHSDVVAEFKKLNLEVVETKPKKATQRPKKQKKQKEKPVKKDLKQDSKTDSKQDSKKVSGSEDKTSKSKAKTEVSKKEESTEKKDSKVESKKSSDKKDSETKPKSVDSTDKKETSKN